MRHEKPERKPTKSIWQSAKFDNVCDRTTASNRPRARPGSPEATAPTAAKAAPYSPPGYIRGAIAKYSTLDLIGWAQCLVQFCRYWIEAYFPAYHHWPTSQADGLSYGVIDYKLPNECKVLMIGDWGTRMTDNVALLRQALKKFEPDAIIHLGDVYYSGTRQECKRNVMDVMDALIEELKIKRPPFFTLPGNHDYYSGGRGFYEMIAKLNSKLPGCEQKASYFCLRTADRHWQFLGMDTGHNDRDPINHKAPGLLEDESAWHRDKLENFAGTTVLLSHHQLYSSSEILNEGGEVPCLNDKLNGIFRQYYDRVAAWFWGHEHCLIIFEDSLPLTGGTVPLLKGRLVGCSAYEETVEEDPYAQNAACAAARFIDKRLEVSKYKSDFQTFYDHAFALLRIEPNNIAVSYYTYPSWDQDYPMRNEPALGDPLYQENLPLIRAPAPVVTPPA